MMRTVWIVSEGSPGHVSQSVGLVDALRRREEISVEMVETRHRFGGFVRSMVRGYMGGKGRGLGLWFVARCLGCGIPPGTPDLIVTSGGKAVFAARSLAVQFSCPLLFVGERKPYPSEWFHTVLTPSPRESGCNDVRLDVIPTSMTRGKIRKAAQEWSDKPEGELWAMIVGGRSQSHPYTGGDWKALASGMNALAGKYGISWLVTTSRRTGVAAESILQSGIDEDLIAKAIWWGAKPEKKLGAFLGAAERIFVTQDSVTMVTEATVAGGRPVVLAPENVDEKGTSFLPGYFSRLGDLGGIERVKIAEMANFVPRDLPAEFDMDRLMAEIVSVVLERLGWS